MGLREEPAADGARLRALLLAFEFAPLAVGGVHRSLGLARHLSAHGVDLDVVCVREADYAAWTAAPIDPSLTTSFPAGVRLHRIASGFPDWYWRLTASRLGHRVAQYAYWGDPVSLFWRGPLLACLDALVSERRPDVILATAPPFGVATLARAVAQRYRLPWVADLRDAWTHWCVAPFPTVAHYWHTRRAEREVLTGANVVVATSHVTRDEWLAGATDVDPGRVVTIYNGFDREPAASPSTSAGLDVGPDEDAPREIVYTGSFYYTPESRAATYRPIWRRHPQHWLQYRLRREDWLYRSPYFFLRGLRRLADARPEIAARLRVTFAGGIPPWLPRMLAETSTVDLVTLAGVLPHADVGRLQRRAAALLLTSAKIEGGRDYSIAGKMYEYFAARAPILAVLTDGAMRDLVLESGLGVFADPDDTDSVADALATIATARQPRLLVTPNERFLDRFDRRALAGEMAAQLRRAAAEGWRA